jgi:hypothetical protein
MENNYTRIYVKHKEIAKLDVEAFAKVQLGNKMLEDIRREKPPVQMGTTNPMLSEVPGLSGNSQVSAGVENPLHKGKKTLGSPLSLLP